MANDLQYKRIQSKRYYAILKKVHHCNKCSYFSRSIFLMLNHVQRHKREEKKFNCSEGVEAFFCTQCQFRTFHTVRFIQHVKKYHSHTSEEKPFPVKCYKCKKCPFETRSILFWYKHRKNRCSVKKKKYEKNLNESSSKITKTKIVPKKVTHKCELCSFESKFPEVLRAHYKQHTSKSQWWECKQCDYKATTKDKLVRHLTRVHSKKFFKCSFCNHKSRRRDNLAVHIKKIHKTEKDPQSNTQIKETTVSGSNKNEPRDDIHLEAITEWFNLEHSIFNTTYLQLIKNPEQPKRDQCDLEQSIETPEINQFQNKNQNVMHFEEKWYSCTHCDYKSRHPKGVKSHINVKHTPLSDKKWFSCQHCDYRTLFPANLSKHIYIRHTSKMSNEWFKCEHCDYKTQVRQYFKRHMCKRRIIVLDEINAKNDLLQI